MSFQNHAKMGRTLRIRKRKCHNSGENDLSTDEKLIELLKWMRRNGYEHSPRLKPHSFSETGRGLMSLSDLKVGSDLIRVPLNLVITRRNCRLDHPSLSTQEALSLFLIEETRKNEKSFWSPYLKSLPAEFSTPAYCAQSEIALLPEHVKVACDKVNSVFRDSFRKVKTLFPDDLELSLTAYRWSWFAVNTRAVFCRGDLALVPFLDFLNHSPDSRVDAFVDETGAGSYKIKTLYPVKKYRQAFICYGPHDNLKLLTEYGFVAPGNPHDAVKLTLDRVLPPRGDPKTAEVIREMGFHEGLCITEQGLSWNLLGCLRIIHLKSLNQTKLIRNVPNDDLEETFNKDQILSLIDDLSNESRKCLEKLCDAHRKTDAIYNYMTLIKMHLSILDQSRKMYDEK